MMPMPMYPPAGAPAPAPSQPTYVTNYYYPPEHAPPQQAPAPPPAPIPLMIGMIADDVDWVSVNTTTAAQHSHRAFIAGKEGWDGSPLWAIRAHYNGEFVPGKFAAKHRAAYIPMQGKEIPVHNFEVLLAKPHVVRWAQSSNGQVPPGAIPAGNTHTGEPLYIARVHYQNAITPGKVHPSHQCAYISFGGNEMSFKQYEVLCKVGG
ncbi:hypothetical protein ABMA28_001583 [Loxostege sticticalis]|uniref:Uncharacterized protein n=1 Tax=Loxostege sticticalis TaxID=481309 RepID=A0ABD0T292_LOXSC